MGDPVGSRPGRQTRQLNGTLPSVEQWYTGIDHAALAPLHAEGAAATAAATAAGESPQSDGPEGIVNGFQKGLQQSGVRPPNVHREYYNLR